MGAGQGAPGAPPASAVAVDFEAGFAGEQAEGGLGRGGGERQRGEQRRRQGDGKAGAGSA